MTMQYQTGRVNPAEEPWASRDARGALLLAEVDFKWLMAGLGWWVDPTRFRHDPSYAARFLGVALESPSFALRECALVLQAQLCDHSPGDAHNAGSARLPPEPRVL